MNQMKGRDELTSNGSNKGETVGMRGALGEISQNEDGEGVRGAWSRGSDEIQSSCDAPRSGHLEPCDVSEKHLHNPQIN